MDKKSIKAMSLCKTITKGEYDMNKKEAWKKFKDTGKIEYYLEYKKGK